MSSSAGSGGRARSRRMGSGRRAIISNRMRTGLIPTSWHMVRMERTMTDEADHAMKISDVIMAEDLTPDPSPVGEGSLPPIGGVMYQYVVAGNGLFIRAEDSRMTALVEIAPAQLNGLAIVVPDVRMKIERASDRWLWSVL